MVWVLLWLSVAHEVETSSRNFTQDGAVGKADPELSLFAGFTTVCIGLKI